MKILVIVKRVIDPYVKIRVKPDNTGVVDDKSIKHAMNPFCEIALEEAVRISKSNPDVEVIVASIGSDICQETLRQGLAMGAHRAILAATDAKLCSIDVAHICCKIAQAVEPDLILMGKQSIDTDNNQTPQMLAALLNWPQATFASRIELEGDKARVTREVDGGLETLQVTLPAVISTDLRLNEPTLPSLPNIMKARQKPLEIMPCDESLRQRQEVLEVKAPPIRKGGIMVTDVDELLTKLQQAGVL